MAVIATTRMGAPTATDEPRKNLSYLNSNARFEIWRFEPEPASQQLPTYTARRRTHADWRQAAVQLEILSPLEVAGRPNLIGR